MPKDERPRPPYLKLVVNHTEEELRRVKLLEAARIREFNAGSFEKAIERRDAILRRGLQVTDSETIEEAIGTAKTEIVHVLDEGYSVIDTAAIDTERLLEWAKRIYINVGVEEFMQSTTAPDLPQQNLARHFTDFTHYLTTLAPRRMTRENVESALSERNIRVYNSDVTRLLVFDINQSRTIPRVLVLPSEHKPYNPLMVLLKGETPMPSEAARLLRVLNR